MLIVEILAIFVSAVALLVAWRTSRQLQSVNAKLDRLQTILFETRQEQRSGQEAADTRIAALDVALQKATGNLRFDPAMSLTHLYRVEPRAQAVLAAFHIGGCASCAVDENGTLADAIKERGADMDRVLTALNTLPPSDGELDLRMPNVHFQL